ncbi:MAG: hypothetical protein FWE67_07495 [Planctomycetaceae bacterium]|nr:hypothetical protein [Planctomycetaceae bacterium]
MADEVAAANYLAENGCLLTWERINTNLHVVSVKIGNSDIMPKCLERINELPFLCHLSLRCDSVNNTTTSSHLDYLKCISSLKSLSITNEILGGIDTRNKSSVKIKDIFSRICHMKELEDLRVASFNADSADDFKELNSLVKIKHLHLGPMRHMPTGSLKHISNLSELRTFSAVLIILSESDWNYLAQKKHLEMVKGFCWLDDYSEHSFESMENLRRIECESGSADEQFITALGKAPRLEELSFSRTIFDKNALIRLGDIPSLRSLELRYCVFDDTINIAEIFSRINHIEKFSLICCPEVFRTCVPVQEICVPPTTEKTD